MLIALALSLAIAAGFFGWQQSRRVPEARKAPVDRTAVPVRVVLAATGSVRDSFAVVGSSNAWRDVDILAEGSGIVRSVTAEVGQVKRAGRPLLKIDDEVAASALRKAKVNRELALRDFERYEALRREGAVSLSSYEAMKLKYEDAAADLVAARRRFDDTSVKAPFTGIVTSRPAEVGDLVQPGMTVANMIDLSKVRIRAAVPEKQVGQIAEGMNVRVTTDVWPGRVFPAKVLSVSAKSSREHTYEVEAVMANPAGTPFRAGMFVRAAFVAPASRAALLIPRQSLVGSLRAPEAFVVSGRTARLRKLAVGSEYGGMLEVLGGIAAGDSVVVNGQHELADGTRVRVADDVFRNQR
jgi:RND family efflux transporter MFP subunit